MTDLRAAHDSLAVDKSAHIEFGADVELDELIQALTILRDTLGGNARVTPGASINPPGNLEPGARDRHWLDVRSLP